MKRKEIEERERERTCMRGVSNMQMPTCRFDDCKLNKIKECMINVIFKLLFQIFSDLFSHYPYYQASATIGGERRRGVEDELIDIPNNAEMKGGEKFTEVSITFVNFFRKGRGNGNWARGILLWFGKRCERKMTIIRNGKWRMRKREWGQHQRKWIESTMWWLWRGALPMLCQDLLTSAEDRWCPSEWSPRLACHLKRRKEIRERCKENEASIPSSTFFISISFLHLCGMSDRGWWHVDKSASGHRLSVASSRLCFSRWLFGNVFVGHLKTRKTKMTMVLWTFSSFESLLKFSRIRKMRKGTIKQIWI